MNKRIRHLKGIRRWRHRNSGASLIMVMLILVIVSMLGIGGIQVSMMGERSARNDRDYQMAWQGAELGLLDAEFDIHGPGISPRTPMFEGGNVTIFTNGCGNSGNALGLCSAVTTGKPAWLSAGFENTSSTSNTVGYGTFTGAAFATGTVGVQPARAPRYIIEPVVDQVGSKNLEPDSSRPLAYRVTSMGFGPRNDIQAVVQMLFRN